MNVTKEQKRLIMYIVGAILLGIVIGATVGCSSIHRELVTPDDFEVAYLDGSDFNIDSSVNSTVWANGVDIRTLYTDNVSGDFDQWKFGLTWKLDEAKDLRRHKEMLTAIEGMTPAAKEDLELRSWRKCMTIPSCKALVLGEVDTTTPNK